MGGAEIEDKGEGKQQMGTGGRGVLLGGFHVGGEYLVGACCLRAECSEYADRQRLLHPHEYYLCYHNCPDNSVVMAGAGMEVGAEDQQHVMMGEGGVVLGSIYAEGEWP